jgi:hypothetical protein
MRMASDQGEEVPPAKGAEPEAGPSGTSGQQQQVQEPLKFADLEAEKDADALLKVRVLGAALV